MKVELLVLEGPHTGKRFAFDRHDNFIVGRGVGSHFRLPKEDGYFSRHHFLVEVNPPLCRLIDLHSSNGTFVNAKRVTQVDLKDGDIIQGGDTTFCVAINALGDGDPRAESAATRDLLPPRPRAAPSIPLPDKTLATPLARQPSDADLAKAAKGKQLFPGFLIIDEIGRGGMGVVYKAISAATGLLVALKVISPASGVDAKGLAVFQREAAILQAFTHPHIVPFRDLGQADGKLYFVMDFVSGQDGHRLVAGGPLPVARAVGITRQLLKALAAAHRAGYVHRDVKPSNLLLEQRESDDYVWLADFGLAREYQASRISGLTRTGDLGGTVAFMAPEQITDFRNVGPAADQYSVAATLYYFLTAQGVYDFSGDTAKQLLKVLQEQPVPISVRRGGLPPRLEQAIHKALARDPAARFADADAFCQELCAAASDAGA
jgi:hypothetical protein